MATGCSLGGDGDDKTAALTRQEPTPPPEQPPDGKEPKYGQSDTGRNEQEVEAPELMGKKTDDATWQTLEQKAQAEGTVAVIVSLKVKARPEGALRAEERQSQRKNISDKRDAILDELKGKEFKNVKDFEAVPFIAMHVDLEALRVLRRSPHVIGITEDELIPLPETGTPNPEPDGAPQATTNNENLQRWWHLTAANVYAAWNNGYDGRGWTVAILDSGVEKTHPWLSNKIVYEACFATRAGTTQGYCPNGTWRQYGAGSARPCSFPACDHGTHVAHIAAGIYGVAPRASIIAVQVFGCCGSDGRASSYTSDQLWGLKTVYDLRSTYRIAALNLSVGSKTGYTAYCDNINADNSSFRSWAATLKSVGIATVVASGNANYYNGLSSPACISNVVSVGNTTLTTAGADAVFGYISYGSNSASFLSMLAPGTSVYSALVNNGYGYRTGTSMAAPHVTGTFAALKQLRPSATVDSSVRAIQTSGKPIYDDRNGVTKARLDVWAAIVKLYNS